MPKVCVANQPLGRLWRSGPPAGVAGQRGTHRVCVLNRCQDGRQTRRQRVTTRSGVVRCGRRRVQNKHLADLLYLAVIM